MSLCSSHVRVRIAAAVIAATSAAVPVAPAAAQQSPQCKPAAALTRVPELPEGSGLAASRKTPGRFWSHNDSGDPVIFALDASGRVSGRLPLSGAKVDDWEAIAVGPCPAGSWATSATTTPSATGSPSTGSRSPPS